MQIGQLARQAGVPVDTVRYYERRGLLSEPVRRPSGYRDYEAADVATLRFIRRSKALGFTLEQTRELLRLSTTQDGDRGEIRALAAQRLADVEERLRELQSVRDTLDALVNACSGHGPVAGCPIVERVLAFESEVH